MVKASVQQPEDQQNNIESIGGLHEIKRGFEKMATLIRPFVDDPGDMKRLDSCIKDFTFDDGWR